MQLRIENEIPPVYYPLFWDTKRYLVLKGGRGSGKTYFAKQKVLLRTMLEEGHTFLVVVKIHEKIRHGIFEEFKKLIDVWKLNPFFKVIENPFTITYVPNGNKIIFTGLDNSEKAKGFPITGLFIDEANHLTHEEYIELDQSLRGETPNYQQVILTFNPVSAQSWLKSEFFDVEDDNVTTLSTTYLDNPKCGDDIKISMDRLKRSNYRKWLVNACGMWGEESTEQAFYHNFDPQKHVSNHVKYNPDLPIWLSFDQNLLPYCACSVWQFEGKTAYQIDEFALKYPHNRTKHVCEAFAKKYANHVAGVRITGDVSGRKEDTRSEFGTNDFTIIRNQLVQFNPITKLPAKNPPVAKNGEFINDVLFDNFEGIHILISDKCHHTIEDLTRAKKDQDGNKHVEKTKHKETGVQMEKTHHFGDTLRYVITYFFQTQFTIYQRGKTPVQPIIGKRHTTSKYRM